MNALCEAALSVLEQVYQPETAVFPFATRIHDGAFRSVYAHPRTMRSTINCLLGLQEAARHISGHGLLDAVDSLVERFLRLHESEVDDPGDLGLLMVVLAEGDHRPPVARRLLAAVAAWAEGDRLRRVGLQDLSWMVWGCVAAARRGMGEAEPVAHRLFTALRTSYLPAGSALARHTLRRGRGPIVSFGASVYFLRAAYEYATAFADDGAMAAFAAGVGALVSGQGPNGEWPWLLHTRDGRPLEVYPVFSVHQHSMAMLFLLPAAAAGLVDGEAVFAKSVAWVGGHNQLGLPMLRREPLFVYRSLERVGRWPRAGRYVRAGMASVSGRPATLAPADRVVVNTESRSYELGWALYALSDRTVLAGIG